MKPSNPSAGEQITDVRFSEDSLIVDLADGRTLTVPLAWFPRLAGASRSELDNWRSVPPSPAWY